MAIFASYFWLWSIIGLLGLMLLYTVGAVLSFGGFIGPIKRSTQWIDQAPLAVKLLITVLVLGIIGYPALIHKLWADATAHEVRAAFETLPSYPGALKALPVEEMSGLYDPTGTEGTYVLGWFGTEAPFEEVKGYYQQALSQRGWSVLTAQPAPNVRLENRLRFTDDPEPSRAQYEVVLAPAPQGSREVPKELSSAKTAFAIRLGVLDPRRTTQVAWFVDCLVRKAPTFPSCEAMGWNPLENNLGTSARAVERTR